MGSGGTKAYAAVVLIRIMYSGMHVMSKVALDQGMNPLVFLFYRHTTAALVLIPATFILERRKANPVTLKIAGKMFIHALYGVTACGDLFNLGLNYASATSSSAMYNVQPVVTFILAVAFGMESLRLKKLHGNVKAAGILLCIAGVAVLALYQGPMLRSFNHGSTSPGGDSDSHSKKQWVLGIFLMTLSNILAGLWTVLQGPLIEDTSKLMNTTLQICCASVQAFVVAAASERDLSKWKLGWNAGLAAIIYSGVVVTALSYYMQMWTIAYRGPVFLAMSMPLTFVFTIVVSSLVLGDSVSLGSVFAGVLLIGGLYNVLWGKSMEEQEDELNKIGAGESKTAGLELREAIFFSDALLGVVLVALYLAVLRPWPPRVVAAAVDTQLRAFSVLPPELNLTLAVEVTVRNPNHAPLRYGEVVTEVAYHGAAVGWSAAPAGKIPARSTRTVRAPVQVDAARALLERLYVVDAVAAGALPFETATAVAGKDADFMVACTCSVVVYPFKRESSSRCTTSLRIT
ncbi:hypothetical protein GUJ93_ZPchr0013g34057 [Zizania palustris]|uniref:WAT1-related protein n=1 Tax=Zizania palustris TaxID=103762 RepID=A0A8J6C531_ZIZPA|nr:hypothetical protein GUJ93_ZPchr0013g34057 [Zizania palustris]